ncbi:alpha/beta fold hydrolase [Thalassomonas actiniarum]|uniref:Alpha/beta fold hydrolase n=1 Tax=Thalassomonas actiniarum TaxID=485447 RepID=A0AAE9YV06_9GAMM|nr:alpha/beta fold hydrolase [Thalassomonas actiniarum]WDE01072.1 alpha/beta fold hydrolase [Thalassomonas actiniarum]
MTIKFNVKCKDGRVLSATKYLPATASNNRFIIINSALGVKQDFYQALAQYLAEHGCTVITWDPRGIGGSQSENVKTDPAKLRDWGSLDLDALLHHVTANHWARWQDITLIGHSAGGHLVGLCRSLDKIRQIILISSGTCSWKLYPLSQWPKMWLSWYLLLPALVKIRGYIPGKTGIGHDLPKGVALDWRNWSTSKEYLFSDRTLEQTYYHEYQGNIHAVGFSDDIGFSPKKTIEDLMARFPRASKQLQIFHPSEFRQKRIGHFGFFKRDRHHLWQQIILDQLPKADAKDEITPDRRNLQEYRA